MVINQLMIPLEFPWIIVGFDSKSPAINLNLSATLGSLTIHFL